MLPETWQPFEVSIWPAQLLQYHCMVSKHAAMSEQAVGWLIARSSLAPSNFTDTLGMDSPSLLLR